MAGPFDLVLMDIQMPVMDGLEATQAIRAFERQERRVPTPIVAFTANARPEDIETSRLAGCTDHLSKPVSKRALLQVVENVEGGGGGNSSTNDDYSAERIQLEMPEGLEDVTARVTLSALTTMPSRRNSRSPTR
jgi:CheY-like chemotaxis protein